jgi:hypothetical protein
MSDTIVALQQLRASFHFKEPLATADGVFGGATCVSSSHAAPSPGQWYMETERMTAKVSPDGMRGLEMHGGEGGGEGEEEEEEEEEEEDGKRVGSGIESGSAVTSLNSDHVFDMSGVGDSQDSQAMKVGSPPNSLTYIDMDL